MMETTETAADGNFQELRDHPQRTSPTRRAAAEHSDIELVGRSQAFVEMPKELLTPDPPVNEEEWVPLSKIQGQYVAKVLEHTRGNKQAAARILNIDRKTLDRMIKRHNIETNSLRDRGKLANPE